MFDRTFVINLERRPERLAAFWGRFPEAWPFVRPQVWRAVDGAACEVPAWFGAGPGAWGCLRTHIAIWQRMLKQGWDSVLIMEDDAVFADKAMGMIREALAVLPADWDQVYFGGQHLRTNELAPVCEVRNKLVRCRYVNRTHCYAIRAKFAEEALDAIDRPLTEPNTRLHHVDYQLGAMHETGLYHIYAPWRFCVGQAKGRSDVCAGNSGRGKRVIQHFWNQFPINEPVAEVV